ncbi:heavy metal-associated domain-containing protein [Croceitalea sp. MTPC9]|uniref:Heavy-metal-associated domain-containing protein n=1 Tax=Croceitalea marina TaxID=1775166 RepID=A0ABW5MVK3_9FLAO|nr:heavy metal-associated domain-containing protein [Croceitalea sp. MTPC6]GMN17219.1 heavy metal-associated domain-containing protein [Croceitalea sp. MTPC9]|tara:strand:- start:398 stop:613 length:216 start_codon:yes stop_codon:yes gene_type:complete
MKKTYSIEGMSCNGCRGHVEKSLLNVTGVADVSVDLEDAQATIESQHEVPLDNLEEALQDSQYSIQPLKVD